MSSGKILALTHHVEILLFHGLRSQNVIFVRLHRQLLIQSVRLVDLPGLRIEPWLLFYKFILALRLSCSCQPSLPAIRPVPVEVAVGACVTRPGFGLCVVVFILHCIVAAAAALERKCFARRFLLFLCLLSFPPFHWLPARGQEADLCI